MVHHPGGQPAAVVRFDGRLDLHRIEAVLRGVVRDREGLVSDRVAVEDDLQGRKGQDGAGRHVGLDPLGSLELDHVARRGVGGFELQDRAIGDKALAGLDGGQPGTIGRRLLTRA